jgi:hypothetical protein
MSLALGSCHLTGKDNTALPVGRAYLGFHRLELRAGIRKALGRRPAHEGVGARPVTRDSIAVEQGRAEDILGARVAMLGGALDEGKRFLAVAVLEEEQAIHRFRLDVAAKGSALIPPSCGCKVLGHAAPEPIGMAKVEGRIGISAFGKRLPLAHGLCIILVLPGIYARFHRLGGERRGDQRGRGGD